MAKLWQYDPEDDSIWCFGNPIIGDSINTESPIIWDTSDEDSDGVYLILASDNLVEKDIRSIVEINNFEKDLDDDDDSEDDDSSNTVN